MPGHDAGNCFRNLGSLETLKDRNKIYALSDGVVQYNIKPDSPLPLKIGKGEGKEVDLYIGDSVEEGYPEEAILFIRTSRPASCRLTVNGKAVEKETQYDCDVYEEDGTSFYWHGEAADVYYMPVQ